MKLKKKLLIWSLLTFAAALPLHAEEAAVPPAGQPPAAETLKRLRQLKEENPEEFRRLIQQRKNQIKSKVQEFRQKNPEKFENFRKDVSENRMNRLRKMKQENPERFQRDMKGRAERFQRLRQENPERFQRFLEKHPRVKERMSQGGFEPSGRQNLQRRQNAGEKFSEERTGRREDLRERSAGQNQNGSQFVPRPDFRKNSQGNFIQGNPGEQKPKEFSQKLPRFQEPIQNRQDLNAGSSGPGAQFQKPIYGNRFQEAGQIPAQGRDFRRVENSPGRGPNSGKAPGQGMNEGGAFRPADASQPRRGGGPGDGARRRDH